MFHQVILLLIPFFRYVCHHFPAVTQWGNLGLGVETNTRSATEEWIAV
jgi:hypothetical protein